MTVFGDGGLRGGIRLNGVRRVGFHLVLRISVLVRKEIRELVLSPHTHTTERPCEHTMRKLWSTSQREGSRQEPNQLSLGLLVSRTGRNTLFKLPRLWYVVMMAWVDPIVASHCSQNGALHHGPHLWPYQLPFLSASLTSNRAFFTSHFFPVFSESLVL